MYVIVRHVIVEEDFMMEMANKYQCMPWMPGWCDSVGGSIVPHTRKSHGFDCRPGHIPSLGAVSLVGCVLEATDPCFSHIDVCLLPPPPSGVNKYTLGED